MKPLAIKINKSLFGVPVFLAQKIIPALEKVSFLAFFGLRLWIANVFWKSGLTKIANWDTTVALFADEYKVPVLSPDLAASMATAVELTAPVLLLFGFGSRFAAAMLLCMTAVIEFSYMSFPEHRLWALILLVILLYGPGALSVDRYIRRSFS
jgi:putative oxidoreductase